MTGQSEQRQRVILKYIAKYQDTHDYPPSVREIQQKLVQTFGRSSTSTIFGDLQALIQKDLLKHRSGQRRATVITGRGRELVATWQQQMEETSNEH